MTVTYAEIHAELVRLCTDNPAKINPQGEFNGTQQCVYDDGHGNRCIAGQAVVNTTGIALSGDNYNDILSVYSEMSELEDAITAYAADLLSEAQTRADGYVYLNGMYRDDQRGPVPWGTLLPWLQELPTTQGE